MAKGLELAFARLGLEVVSRRGAHRLAAAPETLLDGDAV
jgi:hypothetical protein